MTRCSSFLPAATQMIYDMGLDNHLDGITFECPAIAQEEKNVVVRCILEGKEYSSEEIDRIFSASKASGKSLYYVESEKLESIAPDVIFTQDTCEVCQIDTACTASAVAALSKQPELVPLSPNSLQDVFETAITIARALGREECAYAYLSGLQSRMNALLDKQRAHRLLPRRVSLLEWMEPIYNCGHWIPHQVAWAGGIDMLSNPSGDSIVIPFDKIRKYDPEVLVIAPCGFTVERSIQEIGKLTNLQGWEDLSAVRNDEVYIADFDLFTQPSASTLVDGIELLASCFHPQYFEVPAHLVHKVKKLALTSQLT
ncbi:ABC transporter substrate-binding protein [Flavihumibacter rivuli]|uniref:ABC transporter substrate-binding protein n=1 Tax=Flavihumibacter rivuli TaxID=2838156 RepID=UPI001BDF230D|nr:ABC transporter substrate-binding protein [Flavihumibacter rivuli]ULQ56298.1 ABC transporter substrate-binding protein [Flavihumibacter rivuli]